MMLQTLSKRWAPRELATVSPDSAWLATAMSSFQKRVNIWPQDFQGAEVGVGVVEFQREFFIPGPGFIGGFARLFERDGAAGIGRRADVDDEADFVGFAGVEVEVFNHDAAEFGFDGEVGGGVVG